MDGRHSKVPLSVFCVFPLVLLTRYQMLLLKGGEGFYRTFFMLLRGVLEWLIITKGHKLLMVHDCNQKYISKTSDTSTGIWWYCW